MQAFTVRWLNPSLEKVSQVIVFVKPFLPILMWIIVRIIITFMG